MDAAHNQQQKDFPQNLFPMPSNEPHFSLQQPSMGYLQPPQTAMPTIDFDAFNSLLHSIPQQADAQSSGAQLNNLILEQQLKLTQLQQLQALQNKIFQHQMLLLSGQVGPVPPPELSVERTASFQGLPTPASSGEIRPQPAPEFVSPLVLHQYSTQQQDIQNHSYMSPMTTSTSQAPSHQQYYANRGTSSAPANIAFPHQTGLPIDLDISPLASPWLGADLVSRQGTKRTASPSGEEAVRKKHSPAIGPTLQSSMVTKRPPRSHKTSPSFTATRRNSRAGEQESPSPVEMPPPIIVPSVENISTVISARPTPATPASLMGLGAVAATSTSLVPPEELAKSNSGTRSTRSNADTSKPSKPSTKKTAKKPAATPSPQLGPSQPQPGVRKTSHKAAEQKRRDSLKTTFDELRGLLPPIPLPSDENYSEDRILPPGALPPRGPPKAGGEGPNKAVSKLQLLICGNEYIRTLNGRVERRDAEIAVLRKEVRRLRSFIAPEHRSEDDIDLEKDLDAVESLSTSFGRTNLTTTIEEDEEIGED